MLCGGAATEGQPRVLPAYPRRWRTQLSGRCLSRRDGCVLGRRAPAQGLLARLGRFALRTPHGIGVGLATCPSFGEESFARYVHPSLAISVSFVLLVSYRSSCLQSMKLGRRRCSGALPSATHDRLPLASIIAIHSNHTSIWCDKKYTKMTSHLLVLINSYIQNFKPYVDLV